MNNRQEAILQYWSEGKVWHEDPYQKRLRTKLKQAASSLDSCSAFFRSLGTQDHGMFEVGDLQTTAKLLRAIIEDFSVAEAAFNRLKSDVDFSSLGMSDPELEAAIIELFGLRLNSESVFDLAEALLEFSISGADQYARSRGYKSGILHGAYDLERLRIKIKQQDLMGAVVLVAENRLHFRWPGRRFSNSSSGLCVWHAGWDDFMTWRDERSQYQTDINLPGCLEKT